MKTRLLLTLLGVLAAGAVGLSGTAVAQGQGGGRNGATEHGDLQKKGKGDMPPLGGAVTLRPRAAPRH